MLYRYDKKKLMFVSIKKRLLHIFYLLLLTNILSFFYGRYSKSPIVDRYEKEIILQNGSFLLMQGSTQHHWMHEIPRTAKPINSRINLTFRVIQ